MALFKKNALNQITFPLVDKTTFADIESAVTASDFDSQVTKKGFGYSHGGSAATTSFALSKLTSLVRSGVLRQTLKASECNYDRVHYIFRGHTSCADQHIIIDFADNDDSDIMSALTVIQSMASDAASAAQQGASRALINQSRISDVQSFLVAMSALDSDVQSALSDLMSDIRSLIVTTGVTVSASSISDIASAVYAVVASDLSDTLSRTTQINSRVLLIQSQASDTYSLVSDMNSDLRSLVTTTGVQLNASSLSDIRSAIAAGPAATVTASDISDIASAVKAILASDISDIRSLLSDFYSDFQSRVTGTVATASDLASVIWTSAEASDLISKVTYIKSQVSDVQSFLSDMNSDLRSLMTTTGIQLNASSLSDIRSAISAGPTPQITASDISDIASAVRAALVSDLSDILSAAVQTNSRMLINQSRISDTYSMLSDFYSDFQSRVPKRVATDSQLSDMASDLKSAIAAGPAATVTASDISDIASAVRALMASDLSDILSAAVQTNSRTLVIQSLVSDVDSALTSRFSDLLSLVGTTGIQLNASSLSDLRSAISAGPTGGVTVSDISDIASAVRAALVSDLSDILSAAVQTNSRVLVAQSYLSDIRSHVSDLQSDFQSRVPKRVATDSQLSDLASDLKSALANVSITASDISDIASAVKVVLASDLSDILSAATQINSRALVNQSRVSDVYSLLSDVGSDLTSQLAIVGVGVSGISDIASAVKVALASDLSDILSAATQINSRALVNQSRVSDIYSLASDMNSAMTATLSSIQSDLDNIQTRIPTTTTTIKKNAALAAFEFVMLDSADHITGKTGLTVTAEKSIDGAAFTGCVNAVSELANGVYKINLAAADLNGNVVTLKFTSTGADARIITIITQQ